MSKKVEDVLFDLDENHMSLYAKERSILNALNILSGAVTEMENTDNDPMDMATVFRSIKPEIISMYEYLNYIMSDLEKNLEELGDIKMSIFDLLEEKQN